jgi:hypothetical protein
VTEAKSAKELNSAKKRIKEGIPKVLLSLIDSQKSTKLTRKLIKTTG